MNSDFQPLIIVVKVGKQNSEIDMLTNDAHSANERAKALATQLLLDGDNDWTVKTFVEDATHTAEIQVSMRRVNEPRSVE